MIRLAFLGVLALAGLMAFAGFSLMRNTGAPPQPSQQNAATPDAIAPDAPEVVASAPDRNYFLMDQDVEAPNLTLVIFDDTSAGGPLVVTDAAALEAGKDTAFVTPAPDAATPLVALYRGDDVVLTAGCPEAACNFEDGLGRLRAVAQPLVKIDDIYADYTAYLDALSFIQSSPDFALLDLAKTNDPPHPVPQTIPAATIQLPTISQPTDRPLNVETHAALLSAVVAEALPEGVSLTDISIRDIGFAILVDADNGRPGLRGGAPIPFEAVQFYDVRMTVSGAANLDADVLDALTDGTRQTIDWEDQAKEFIGSLGLTCSDCYAVRLPVMSYDRATVTDRTPERYALSYYDLRDPP